MNREGAQVHSLAVLDDFRAALAQFADSAKTALELADLEIRKTIEWVSHEQLAYWKVELRRRDDAIAAAKQELHRARMSLTAFGHVPDCADQKAALAKAKLRYEEAERKIANIKRWSATLKVENDDYLGPARQLLSTLEGEVPKSLALLDRMARSLESYVEVAPPSSSDSGMAGRPAQTAALPNEPVIDGQKPESQSAPPTE